MAILDTDRILNGTDTKQLINAYENLKSSYSNDSAKSYCSYYKGKPLSFIMKNARYIIAEPQFGLPFVQWVATSFPLTFLLRIEFDYISNYIVLQTLFYLV